MDYWQKFVKSGSVEDYLEYLRNFQNSVENKDDGTIAESNRDSTERNHSE